MEGSRDSMGAQNTRNVQSYEGLALSVFKFRNKQDDVHCLEEDSDLRSIGSLHGVDPTVTMSYSLYEPVRDVFQKISQRKLPTYPSMIRYIEEKTPSFKKQVLPSSTITESDIIEGMVRTAQGFMIELVNGADPYDLQNSMNAGYTTLMNYFGRVRDYEWLGPNASKLSTQLPPGELVIVVGKNHVPAMKAALRGLPIRRPLPWNEYKETLDPKVQKSVSVFERVAQWREAA